MTAKRNVLLVAFLALIGPSLMPADALAQAERIDFEVTPTLYDVVPGKTWYSADGKIQHVRGQAHYNTFDSDEPLVAGNHVQITDYDLNTETGEATVNAKWVLTPSAFPDGEWVGTVQGKINFYTGSYCFHAVARGTGSLKGMKMVLRWQSVPIPGCILVPHGT